MYEWASGTGEFCAILLHGSSLYVCDSSMRILAVSAVFAIHPFMYCSVVCSPVTWLTLPPLHHLTQPNPAQPSQIPSTRIIPSTPSRTLPYLRNTNSAHLHGFLFTAGHVAWFIYSFFAPGLNHVRLTALFRSIK